MEEFSTLPYTIGRTKFKKGTFSLHANRKNRLNEIDVLFDYSISQKQKFK